jgi:hypothetical protein
VVKYPTNDGRGFFRFKQTMAEDFLDSSYDLDECNKPEDVADPILSVCVLTILRSQGDDIADISLEEILEKVTIYCLSLIMEAVDRESKIGIEQPALENILSWDIIKRLKVSNPQFVETLEQACILREPKQSWFEKIKEKFL